jgi:multidrug resistance efflux pump
MISPFGQSIQNGASPVLRSIAPPPAPPPIRLNPNDEVEALMGNPPRWIVRWGISLLAGVVVVCLLMSFIIKFPDTLTAKVSLMTQNPPIRVMSLTNGKISHFFIQNNEAVDSGKVLAVLENTANWQDVLTLETQLIKMQTTKTPLSINLPTALRLGNLQASFAQLSQNWHDFTYFKGQNGIGNKVENLRQQIGKIEKLKKSLEQQRGTLSNEVTISQNDLLRNQKLYSQGVVSKSDLEKFSTQYLQAKRQLEAFQTQIINNDILQKQLEGQILESSQSKKDNTNNKSTNLDADIDRLLGEIREWKRIYLLTAPISGKIAMTRVWSPQQYVNANEDVLTVVPSMSIEKKDSKSLVHGKALLPIEGAGKVKVGQPVQIRLDGFPYQEYGSIEAKVQAISLVPQQDNYLVEIEINQPNLVTTYNKTIPFRQEMQGTARIITEDRRIISRIFNQIESLFKNR